MKQSAHLLLGLLGMFATLDSSLAGPEADTQGPRFTPDGKVLKPENYREWVNVGTGLNMAYGPAMQMAQNSAHPPFTNVFVNPPAYRSFLANGVWPDQTMMVLEIRAAESVNKTVGNNGYYQGELLGLEAEIKDEKRFPGKWAFFALGKADAGTQLPAAASCYSCHAKNAAADNTFVQFYPVLRDVAKAKGTLKEVPEVF